MILFHTPKITTQLQQRFFPSSRHLILAPSVHIHQFHVLSYRVMLSSCSLNLVHQKQIAEQINENKKYTCNEYEGKHPTKREDFNTFDVGFLITQVHIVISFI